METDWNLLPWQPSPPRRLPPRLAWCLSRCNSEQTNMQNNIWKTKARTLTADATVKPLTQLRALSSYSAIQSWHSCFSPDMTSAPRLCVFCVNVTTRRSAPHTHSCPPDLWNVCTKSLQEGEIIMQLKDMVWLWSFNLHHDLFLPAICSVQTCMNREKQVKWVGTAVPNNSINYWCSKMASVHLPDWWFKHQTAEGLSGCCLYTVNCLYCILGALCVIVMSQTPSILWTLWHNMYSLGHIDRYL